MIETGFLYNLFADPDIIRLPGPLAPLQNLIALFISKRRAPKSRAAYESIGGGSPILQYSTAQANLLCQALEQSYGLSAKAYIGMRYWKPYTEDALEQIRRDGIEALVIVPLYPQFSISTSGSSLRVLQEEFSARAHLYSHLQHTVVPSWYDRPGYIQAMADLICHELQQFTKEQIEWAMQQQAATITSSDDKNQTKTTTTEAPLAPLHVLFSAHGVPQSYIEAGDPYQEQIQDCVQSISEAVQQQWKSSWKDANANPPPAVEMHLSYQSRVGPIEWLRPYTDDVLPELGARGVKNLVVVPISFVSEHIETLEEIDMEYRELAEESGIVHWRRCPALNTNEAFIRDLAAMVVQALEEPAQTVTEACVANRVAGIGVELQPPDEEPEGIFNTAGVQGASGGARSGGGWFRGLQQQQRRKESSSSSSSIASTGTTTGSPGALKEKERLNARVAMVGVLITILVELFNGKSLVQMFGHS